MNARQGDEMKIITLKNSHLLHHFLRNPEQTVDRAIREGHGQELLQVLLAYPVDNMVWSEILRLGESLSADTNYWFQEIVRSATYVALARQWLRISLLTTLLSGGPSMPNLERAIMEGAFNSVVCEFSTEGIRSMKAPLNRAIATVVCAERIQRFLNNKDFERAFGELVYSAKIIDGWRPDEFQFWVEQVWYVHHRHHLVDTLTGDSSDWRRTTEGRPVRCGRIGKKEVPYIHTETVGVPMTWLWGSVHQAAPLRTPVRRMDPGGASGSRRSVCRRRDIHLFGGRYRCEAA